MLTPAETEEIIRLHHQQVASGQALRNLSKRQVSRIAFNGMRYVVKAYLRRWWHRLLHILPGDTKSQRLLEGFTPPCLADTAQTHLWQFTIYPDAGAFDLYELIKRAPLPSEYASLYAKAGELLARIHQRGVYHGDTKPPNFVINTNLPELPPVVIVDCDHLIAYRQLPEHRRVFNLAQFIATNDVFPENRPHYPECISTFAEAYATTSGFSSTQMNALLTKALQVISSSPRIEKRIDEQLIHSIEKQIHGKAI